MTTRRIKPLAGAKSFPAGGGSPSPADGIDVEWDIGRDRPAEQHWARYLAKGVVFEAAAPMRPSTRPTLSEMKVS